MSEATDRANRCRTHAAQWRVWAELAVHKAAKEGFTQVADEWASLAGEIEQIEIMRKFTYAAERAASKTHVD